MRSPEEIERVKKLSAKHNKCEIARLTGIPPQHRQRLAQRPGP